MNEPLNIPIIAYDRTKGVFNKVAQGLGVIKKQVFSLKTAFAGIGFGLAAKEIISINAEFQSLEASLKTFTGSAQVAGKVFGVLQDFAAQTPFSLQEVVTGFNRLISVGLNPSIVALEAFGNIASGTGKTLIQFVEAAADAAVGEFERLKEFGIKARTEGDKVTFTFKGVETEVKKNASAISDYLITLGQTEFGGAIAEQSKTLRGAFSNLGDSFSKFAKQIGDAGLNDAVVRFAKALSNVFDTSQPLAEVIGKNLADALNILTGSFDGSNQSLIDFINNLTSGFLSAVSYTIQAAQNLSNAFIGTHNAINLFGDDIEMVDFSGFLTSIDNLKEKLHVTVGTTTSAKKTTEELNEALKETGIDLGSVSTQLTAGQKALKDYASNANDVKESLAGVALNGVKSLEDGLVDIVSGAKSAKEAFKSMASSIINDLIRIMIQKSITGPIANALGGMFSGKAIGGPVQRNTPYLVGERGPELFMPSASGSIVPTKDLSSASAGVTVNQTINVTTGIQQTVRAEIANLMPQIAQASKAAVAEARQRGGSFSKAMGTI